MKKLFLSAVLLFCLGFVYAQKISIQGKVVNNKTSQPLEGASVLIFHSVDTSLIKAEVSDKTGIFTLNGMEPGNYLLEISSVGFEPYYGSVSLKTDDEVRELGEIALVESARTLEGVVVDARKPLVERKIDKLVYNVSSDISASGSSALEMLEKAPGVTVDKDGNISLRGKSGVTVLIDDRPTYMSSTDLANYLKGLPAVSLSQVEIMTNPSAKYDAAGNSGIINLKTKKLKSYGMNGSFNSSLKYTDRLSGSANANFNYRNGKVNLFGNYGHTTNNYTQQSTIIRYFKDESGKNLVSSFDQSTDQPGNYNNDNLKLGMDYYAGKNTIAGIVVSGFNSRDNDRLGSESWFKNASGVRDSGLTAVNDIRVKSRNFSGNVNLRHTFDTTGKKMTVDLDYITYDKPQTTSVTTNYLLPDGTVQRPSSVLAGNTPSTITIYSAKTDFTLPFGKFGQIETGLKGSHVETDNNAQYTNIIGGHPEVDYGKSNHFIYKESIVAGYVSWSKQIKKWGFQAGLRAENTHSSGHQLGNPIVPDSSFTKSYLNLFPTAYVSLALNENNNFGLNFGRRIQRPNYADLNPFIYFIDEYTYQAGNVFLQPQFTNQIAISHSYKSFLQTSVSYSHTSDVMTQLLKQDTAKRAIYQTTDNLAEQSSLTFSSGVNFKTGKHLTTNLDVVLNHQKYDGRVSENYFIHTAEWVFTGKLTEQAVLGKGWSAELSGLYLTPQPYGQMQIGRLWRVDGSVQKKILKGKGDVGLNVRDIFNSMQPTVNVSDNNMHIFVVNKSPNPSFNLSFKYSFGKPIKGLKRYNPGGASDEQSRVGGK